MHHKEHLISACDECTWNLQIFSFHANTKLIAYASGFVENQSDYEDCAMVKMTEIFACRHFETTTMKRRGANKSRAFTGFN